MDKDINFVGEVNKLLLGMRFIADLDLSSISNTVAYMHSFGPFVDPTQYRDQVLKGDADAVGELAQALGKAVEVWNDKIAPRLSEYV